MSRPRLRPLLVLAGLPVLVALAACREPDPVSRPLVDSRLPPDVLVETDRLTPGATLDGNRFVAGWRMRREPPPALVADAGGARLELVRIGTPRMRRLELVLDDPDPSPVGKAAVRIEGRHFGHVRLDAPLEIRVPIDVPNGRVLVEITPYETPLVIREARLSRAKPAGEARFEGLDVVQSAHSRIDFVRRVSPGEKLVGRFVTPTDGGRHQHFLVEVELPDGSRAIAYSWGPMTRARLLGKRRFELPLGDQAGFVRVSLEARGEGPPGRWTDLALVGGRPPAGPAPPEPAPPEPVPTGPPPRGVVLYVLDALRADAVGGDATPTWNRLARAGMSFQGHRSVAPNTLPATKALLTGEAYAERGGWDLPAGVATLAEAYRRAGYRTALFSGNVWVGPAYGVDRGFEHVVEVPLDERRASYNDNAERLHEAALAWLGALAAGERFFVYVHAVHPHNPYDPPEPWRPDGSWQWLDGSTRTLLDIQRRRVVLDDEGRERVRRLYAAGLAYADAELGRFLAAVERRVAPEDLLLAVTSDHGEELFDHGGVLHGYTLYEEMIRVPLVVRWPGRVAPGAWTGMTGTLDLHATLAAVVAPDAASEGRSLWPVLRGAGPGHDDEPHFAAAASVKGGIYSVQSARWKLIWAPRRGRDWGLGGGAGRSRSVEYLFDLESDPEERVNRAGEGGLEVAWLRSRLRAWIAAKTSDDAEPADDDEPTVDEEVRRRLEALGYLE